MVITNILMSSYYVPGPILSLLSVLAHLVISVTLFDRYDYYYYFTNEKSVKLLFHGHTISKVHDQDSNKAVQL